MKTIIRNFLSVLCPFKVVISLVAYLLALFLIYLAADSSIAKLINADIVMAAHPLLISATAFIALAVVFLAGLYPSYYITSFPPALVLKGSFSLSPKGRMLRNILISIQFIASFVFII